MDFEQDVIARSHQRAVLVDFWAPWCGPCQTLGPILDKVAADFSGRLDLVKLNTEEQPELAARFGIRGIPNCKLFVDGEVAAEFSGALPEAAVVSWLKQNLPSAYREVIRQAAEALAAGHCAAVVAALEPVAQAEPDNPQVLMLLARAEIWQAPEKAAKWLGQVPVNADETTLAEPLKQLARQLAQVPETAVEEGEAGRLYAEACRLLRAGQLDAGIDALLASIKADRHYAEDAARKAVLGLMAYWDDDAARVNDLRKRLSAVLFR